MARVTGPAFSLEASGKLGDAIVYSSWKGRQYVRELVAPSNPKTAKQVGIRSMMKALSQSWAGLSSPDQATWETQAASKNISPFNAFVSYNMDRWLSADGVTEAFPAAELVSVTTLSAHTYTGGVGVAHLDFTLTTATDMSFVAIFRSTSAITVADWTKCIAVIPVSGTDADYVDTNLDAGTYHYRAVVLTNDGKLGTVLADDTCVVS